MEILDFGKIEIPWQPKEIYNYLFEHTENMKKYNKNKCMKAVKVFFLDIFFNNFL